MQGKLVAWKDYMALGLALAVLLSMLDMINYHHYQIILIGVFFVMTGARKNVERLVRFVSAFPIWAVIALIWIIYFRIFCMPELGTYKMVITVYLLTFAAFCVGDEGEEQMNKALYGLWFVLVILSAIGVLHYFLNYSLEYSRMFFFYLNPIAEGDAAVALMLISVFFVDKLLYKITGVIVAFLAVLTGANRVSTMLLVIIGIIWLILNLLRKEWIGRIKRNWKKIIILLIGFVGVICVAVYMAFKNDTVRDVLTAFVYRYISSIKAFAHDPYLSFYADSSYRIRVIAIDQVLQVFRQGNIIQVLLGQGKLRGYYGIKYTMEKLMGIGGDSSGPIENSFFLIITDYGLVGFTLYLSIFISSLHNAIKSNDTTLRKLSISTFFVLLASGFIDEVYWINVIFLVWMFVGLYIWQLSQTHSVKVLIPSVAVSTYIGIVLLFIPRLSPWLRTVFCGISNKFSNAGMIIILVTSMLLVTSGMIVWNLTNICLKLVSEKHLPKENMVYAFCGMVVFTILVISGNVISSIYRNEVIATVDSEKQVLEQIKKYSKGNIYVDSFPKFYMEEIEGLKTSLFNVTSMASEKNVSLIMDKGTDTYITNECGFVYLPISDKNALYTSDQRLISALTKLGYRFTGYCTFDHEVDVQQVAEAAGLQSSDDGSVILDGKKGSLVEYGGYELYGGKYTVNYQLKLKDTAGVSEDQEVCVLEVYAGEDQKSLARSSITKKEFDEDGYLSYDMQFNAGKDTRFLVWMSGDYQILLDSITYSRTPDADIRFVCNERGLKIHEEYYDLEGKRYINSAGYSGLDNEYDDDNRVIKRRFLDESNKPVITFYGCAECSNEYDNDGNNVVESYYGVLGEPVLRNGGYHKIVRVFNENRQCIHEEYRGTDDKPIMLSNGSCGYNWKYDVAGNVIECAYLGENMEPALNTSGFAMSRRDYNDLKQIIKEYYCDEKGNLIALPGGQAAVEYEYDEAGNCNLYRYYDVNGEPVLYAGAFWFYKITYNDKRQNILEEYFGLDGKPVIMPDGASAYAREYDDVGNVIRFTYLDVKGNPTLNINNYSSWIYQYNDKRQVVSEEYYGLNGEPVLIGHGYTSVKYRYNDDGTLTQKNYYSLNGELVNEEIIE